MSRVLQRCAASALAVLQFTLAFAVDARADALVKQFAQSPRLSLAALSPDGHALSFIEQVDGHQVVTVRALGEGGERHTLSTDSQRERIRWCDWAGTYHLLCGTVLPKRHPDRVALRSRLYAINVETGETRELKRRWRGPGKDQLIGFVRDAPHRVLLQHDPRASGFPEVIELDVATGSSRRIVRSHPPVRRWMSDHRGRIVLGIGYEEETATLHVRRSEASRWSVWLEQRLSDPDAIGPLAVGAHLYVLKHHHGRTGLFWVDIAQASPEPRLMFADPAYDVTGPIALDHATGRALSIQYVNDREAQQALDDEEARHLTWVDEALPGLSNLIVDRSDDGDRLLVRSSSDVDPPTLYLYDSAVPSLTLIGHEYPEIEDRSLAPMKSVVYAARDGQRIPAYLTLPLHAAREPLPAIILPHGGPETRNWRAFDPLVQFLAARGYVVLQMNYRGSFGYGAGFAAAGAGQWGGVIHNDITDGARWLVEQEIADPKRLCIVGLSFGGYAALLGAARESQWYSCAASYAGVSDLLALSQYTERLQDADVWRQRLGDDSQALWQMSPIARARRVETPVLLMHGRQDAVVPVSQSKRFARALRELDKPHRFIQRSDCDHEMTVQSCRLAFFAELQEFLATSLR